MWNYKIATATFRTSQCQDGDEVLKKDALDNLNTQENIKKDSTRYFAEIVWKIMNFISLI